MEAPAGRPDQPETGRPRGGWSCAEKAARRRVLSGAPAWSQSAWKVLGSAIRADWENPCGSEQSRS